MMKGKLSIIGILAAAILCGCNSDIKIAPGQAYFKSFTYTGDDSFFGNTKLDSDEIYNPILQGSYSDASICRKGNDYYLVTSNFTFYPGVPVLHSTDLVNWEQLCYALPTEKQLLNTSLKADQGLYPNTIRYDKKTDTFYITGTLVGGGGHFVIKAKDPAGPWTDPEWIYGLGGVHPSLFFDDDGKAYILNQAKPDYEPPYYDYKAIWCQEFDLELLKPVGERFIILAGGDEIEKKPSWLEAPHLYKINGLYYLIASEGGSLGNGFSSCVYKSEKIRGPYVRYHNNPIVTQRRLQPGREDAVTSTGHVDITDTPDGKWYAVFQGIRPYSPSNDYCQGRETFLMPVYWDNEWPFIIRNGESITNKIKAPNGAKYIVDSIPFTRYIPHGNFKYVENFVSDQLPLQWSHLRTPSGLPIVPNGERGLLLPLESNNIRSQRHAGFVGFRQMHIDYEAEVEMHFMPQSEHEFAGLALYLNDEHNYQLGVTLHKDKNVLILQRAAVEDPLIIREEMRTKQLPDFNGRIFLKVKCKSSSLTFYFKTNIEDEYAEVESGVSTEYLSLSRNNSFYGVTIGPYASQEEGN